MQIPVLVEQLEKGYRARAGDFPGLVGEGKTQTEALDKLQKLIEERRAAGTWITYLDIPGIDSPLMRMCGTLDPDDPAVQDWQREMAEYRKQRNAELDEL